VLGILAEAYIGNDGKIRMGVLDRPGGSLNDTIVCISPGAEGIFAIRKTEQNDRGYPGFCRLTGDFSHPIDGMVKLARHGFDGLPDAMALNRE
jgi:hypothetical protein